MAPPSRVSTSTSSRLISNQCGTTASASHTPFSRRPGTARPSTGRRSRAGSTIGGGETQQIICAISEGRGVAPTVGLSFVNISTGEAVLSQICDTQFYARTLNKIQVFEPTEILIVSTAGPPNPKSKMYEVMEENVVGARIVCVDRRYWSENTGLEYIQQLAFQEDVQAIRVAIGGNYFATCCFAAVLKYIDLSLSLSFAFHSLRIKYQPSEGSMMIDLSTIQSLELIQNLQNAKSKDCLFGLLNQTLTPMGSRTLRSNILQPSTQKDVLILRYEALEELTSKQDMFFQTRKALKPFLDIEKLLTTLILIPTHTDIHYAEQSINNILMLKSFLQGLPPTFDALSGATSNLLIVIQNICRPEVVETISKRISDVINEDVTYQRTPLDLRNQRTYAVKSGVSGLLDVARQTFKEATEDVHQHVIDINQQCEMQADLKYDNTRQYWLRIPVLEFESREVPKVLINRYDRKGHIECQTLDLVKLNQRIVDSHNEVVLMSDKTIQKLLDDIRGDISSLFKICEGLAMLDMIAAFGQLVTTQAEEYVKPEMTDCLVIQGGRHPVKEKIHTAKFVANDVYASQQTRFQIVTGCNMSGKSTYIRSVALMSIMAQVGCFVPAQYASFPIIHQLFARVSMDDNIEANVSTFASEMRETAFILRNIDKRSLAIIDELGRGTSTQDGFAIALSIAEALVESRALVWFATHFRDLAKILSRRPGVVNLHLQVEMTHDAMTMLYKIGQDVVKEELYGLALARVVGLPPKILEVAEDVSQTLQAKAMAKKKSSRAFAIAKRRKLILSLKEALNQAQDSPMHDEALLSWLQKLQAEFVLRMDQIEQDVRDMETAEYLGDQDGGVSEEEKDALGTAAS